VLYVGEIKLRSSLVASFESGFVQGNIRRFTHMPFTTVLMLASASATAVATAEMPL
jgi:hypothetical protein